MKSIRNRNPAFRINKIHPVILAVPDAVAELTPKERVKFLSRHARRALEISAERSLVPLGKLIQDERNAPVPFNGIFWSLTHKREYVGGVIAPSPIGIDIEKICSRAKSMFRKTASDTEWALMDTSFKTFFRYWTAKEAVLKAAGIGLTALSKCRVTHVIDPQHLDIAFEGNTYRVQHHYFDDHIASVVKNDLQINWTIMQA